MPPFCQIIWSWVLIHSALVLAAWASLFHFLVVVVHGSSQDVYWLLWVLISGLNHIQKTNWRILNLIVCSLQFKVLHIGCSIVPQWIPIRIISICVPWRYWPYSREWAEIWHWEALQYIRSWRTYNTLGIIHLG